MLEKITHNHVYKHVNEKNPLYKNQLGFQQSHSTEQAVIHPVNQINSSFEKNFFVSGIFIDLSKAFDTLDHKILDEVIFNGLKTISLIGGSLLNTAT